jgi:hypothetical protein
MVRLLAPAANRAVTDIASLLHAVKPNLVDDFVGTTLCSARVVAKRSDAQHPSATGHHILA